MTSIIITAAGADRPGMVAALSAILAENQCNLEDCTMTRLNGQFTMMLMVQLPANMTLDEIKPSFTVLQKSHGLNVHCHEATMRSIDEDAPRHMLTVYAADRPGLLAAVSQILAEYNVNITDVQTRLASSGALYVMLFEIEIPGELDADELRNHLQEIGQKSGMTLTLRPIEEDIL